MLSLLLLVLVLDDKFTQTTALVVFNCCTDEAHCAAFIDGDRASGLLGGPTRVDGLALHQRGGATLATILIGSAPNSDCSGVHVTDLEI